MLRMLWLVILFQTTGAVGAQGTSAVVSITAHVEAPTSDDSSIDKNVSVVIEHQTLEESLKSLQQVAGVRLRYDTGTIRRVSKVVSLREEASVARVLRHLLNGTNLAYQISPDGAITILRSEAGSETIRSSAQPRGTIVGTVRDASTGNALFGATVTLEDEKRVAVASATGTYRLQNVPAGAHLISARRLGYSTQTVHVSVLGEVVDTVDFHLVVSPAMLNQVVTTVTGDQDVAELGNSVGKIHADSVVNASPITSLSDIITARVPGVQVYVPGGMSGESPQINIRGVGSITNSSQPLLVIDGVRVANSAQESLPIGGTAGFGTGPGRFDDINPNDVEAISIVRGPSAATLYGTDAANGVIVVTTKHGSSGAPRWSLFTEQGVITGQPSDRFSYEYSGIGHLTGSGGSGLDSNCTLVPLFGAPSVTSGTCSQDKVTHFSPLRDPSTTPIGQGERQGYGLQVSGGNATRYFVSGNYETQYGYLKLPEADRALVLPVLGASGISSESQHPDGYSKAGARTTLFTALGSSADISVGIGYLSNSSHLPNAQAIPAALSGPGYLDANAGYGSGQRPYLGFLERNDQSTDHLTISATPTWTPFTWLSGHATSGVDYTATSLNYLQPNNALLGAGQLTTGSQQSTRYTLDVVATATGHPVPWLRLATSLGGQYTHTFDHATAINQVGLAFGQQVAGGGTQTTTEIVDEELVAGAYAQEEVALDDELFLTVAAREDGAGSFGQSFRSALYPKVSGSWLVSHESFMRHIPMLSSFRLRGAYGQSGIQPPPAASLANVSFRPAIADGNSTTGAFIAPGLPRLSPEIQGEFEGGLDVGLLAERVQLQVTRYYKRSNNSLISVPVPTDAGGYDVLRNVSAMRNDGWEALASVQILANRLADWTITVNGSVNNNKLLRLGAGAPPYLPGYSVAGLQQGFPAFSTFDHTYTYKDANHDGIIEPNEITLDTAMSYLGQTYPPSQVTFSTALRVLDRAITLSAQLDSRSGFNLANFGNANGCFLGTCRALVDRSASLADQAAAGALVEYLSYAGFVSNASFTRLREVAVTLDLGRIFPSFLKRRSASLTLSARNLALWTRYRGADPEVSTNAGPAYNQGAYQDSGGYPPARYYLLRASIGL